MARRKMKPGNMLYPVPAALVSVRGNDGRSNLLTVAWCGTICSDPPMVYVSVRKNRFSHHMIAESGEFVINLTTESMVKAVDFCGVRSGKDMDKWKESGLHEEEALTVKAPLVKESPLCIECRVTKVMELGSHDMFMAEVTAVQADESYFDEKDRFDLKKTGLVAYSHGDYMSLGKVLGTFGYSVRKKKTPLSGNRKPKNLKTGKKS